MWRLETHSFVLSAGEPTDDGEVVIGWTDNSQDFLVNQSLAIFSSKPIVSSSSKSYIELAWVRHTLRSLFNDTLGVTSSLCWIPPSLRIIAKWSHHPQTRVWMSRSAASIRHDIDYMNEVSLGINL
ncbi:hypothetical protein Ahy_B06g082559 [Arachis hypogaea]|uniref:Uncharacterized protein n=1 Tax=Arachis hypogaea TaxID=3818 RepID=A0A444YNS9_ARAHY|nr:hypothetical protein Ahy_B06g082559 [Arachis hypogaea]